MKKAKRFFFVVMMLLLTFGLFACKKVTVTLTGANELEVGKTIVLTAEASKSGAKLEWASSNDAVATVVNGTVTGVSAGTVTITVKATSGNKTAEATITITVKAGGPGPSNNAPVFNGIQDRVIDKGANFIPMEGVTAWDEEDGDITNKIVCKSTVRTGAVGVYEVTYTVTDKDLNTTTVTCKVTVVFNDKDAPLLTGTANKTIIVGDTAFTLKDGVIATDTNDGDLTSKIEVSGDFDPWTLGEYTINYSVKDSAGNEAKAARKITVGVGEFKFAEANDKEFAKDGNQYKFNVSIEKINTTLANFALAKLTFKVNASASCEIVPSISNGDAPAKIALQAGDNTVEVYFRVNSEIDGGNVNLTVPENIDLTFSDVKFAFGEAKDMEAPVITLPGDEDLVLPGNLDDVNALKSFVLNGVSAQDNIDGIVTAKLDVDFTGIELGNCYEEKDVTIFVVDSSQNRAEVKRHVKFTKVYDTKLIKDPEFNTEPEPYDPETHIGWGLNGGGGAPEIKIEDGVLVHHNTTNDNPGWDSASSPFFRTTTEYLSPFKWYLLKFDVKAAVARKMTIRIGLETTEALGWIENFNGANNTPFNITEEWQTCYVLFYVHAAKSQAGMDVAKIEFKIGTFTWGGEEQGNTVYFDNCQIYLLTNENSAPKLTIDTDLPTSFGKGEAKPDLTKYVIAHDLEDAADIQITAANITESIDMNTPGTYDVVYKVQDSEGAESTITLKIKVLNEKDTVAPVLAEAAGIVKEYDQFSQAPDLTKLITATDNVDGAITITKSMITTDADIDVAGSYEVKYVVKDTSGNVSELTITLVVKDKEAPKFTGKDTMKTLVGEAITASDIIATLSVKDNVDGTITLTVDDVKDLDKVDFNAAGEYIVKVEAVDAAGNKAEFALTIVVRINGATQAVIDSQLVDLAPQTPDKAENCVVTLSDEEYKIEVAEIGGWASYNKMKLLIEGLQEGKTYALKFVAKADEARKVKMNLGIGLWADPWMNHFKLVNDSTEELEIGTEYAEYLIYFTYDQANVDSGPTLEFCVGPIGSEGDKAGNNIYFKELAIYSTKEIAAEVATEIYDFMNYEFVGENATIEVNDGVLTIDPTDVGGWASFAKTKISGVPVEDGKTYELRITAKANEPRKIQFNIGVGLWADPWMDKYTLAEEGSNILELSTNFEEYVIRFTVDKETRDGGPTMEFCVGAVGSEGDKVGNVVTLSQFKLFEIETGGSGDQPEAPGEVIVLDDFEGYADTAALAVNWNKRYDGVNYTEGFELVELDGKKVVKFNYASDKKYLLRYVGSSFPELTDDYKYIRFKAKFADEETPVEVWVYWNGSQNGLNFVPKEILSTDGYYYIALAKWSKKGSDINGFAIGFNYKGGEVAYFDTIEFITEKPDTEAPVISVSDSVAQQVQQGLVFPAGMDLTRTFNVLREGVTATDNVDGDIPIIDSMIDLGGLDLTNPYAGTFTVTITVKDEAGNAAKVEIPVVIQGENGLVLDLLRRGFTGENATVEIADGVATINPTNVGTWASYAKIKLTNLGLVPGETYELRVKIKADEPRKVQFNIGIGLWADPWMDKFTLSQSTPNIIDVTAEYVEYAVKFEYDKENRDGGPTIEFCVGAVGSDGDKVDNKIYVESLGLYTAEPDFEKNPPVITVNEQILNAIKNMTFMEGDDVTTYIGYIKTGTTATDDTDGNITITDEMIDLGGLTPQSLVAGDYVITITVVDSLGNVGTKTIDIHVSTYANENLLADLPQTNADYTSDKWTREKYGNDGWVAGGDTRSREKDGIRVMNMTTGYSMVYRYTYNKGGSMLGIANTLSFKMGNYWSPADVIEVKVILIDKFGMSHYLLGGSDEFYQFPVTTGLEDFNLKFDDMDVKSVAIAAKSALNGTAFLYVGELFLKYVDPDADTTAPVITVSDEVQQFLATKEFVAGTDESQTFAQLLAGLSANDETDGPIAITEENVDLGGLTIDNLVAGNYKITVTVKDAAGNEGKLELNITVKGNGTEEPTKANVNLLADIPQSDGDYVSSYWTREMYTTSWGAGGDMRSREKDGIRVSNFSNGYGMTMRWTYSDGGKSLGLANNLSLKAGNYFTGAEVMQIKLKVVDVENNEIYLVGSADAFFDFPVTEGLQAFSFDFTEAEIKAVVLVTKSAKQGNAFFYAGDVFLTYVED